MRIRKLLIRFYYRLQNNHILKYLNLLNSSAGISYKEHLEMQFKRIQELLNFSYHNVPFYKFWFDQHEVDISKINTLEDFASMVPILTKSDIIEHYHLFSSPAKSKLTQTTGGSTGQTLKFRRSKKDIEMGNALLLRGMGIGGYTLGDRILVLAGGSLVKKSSRFKPNIVPRLLNQYKFSSYGLEQEDFIEIVQLVNKKNIRFVRGYASSIYYLADYCRQHAVDVSFQAIFSTAERLLENQRSVIEQTFNCKVYNQYGLNDGGVSAYEHNDEDGFIVDMERSRLEIAGSGGGREGTILATSFLNYAFPFIRYDTGDRGIGEVRELRSGVKRPVITKLLARETEYLLINNKKIGGPVLTVLMGKTNAEQYRIIQKKTDEIEIQIRKGRDYSQKDEEFMIRSFRDNCGPDIIINFTYVDAFSSQNKHKFIIKEVEN